jgi:protein-S-isoprenylcysteine O-methyltransferase Ste14
VPGTRLGRSIRLVPHNLLRDGEIATEAVARSPLTAWFLLIGSHNAFSPAYLEFQAMIPASELRIAIAYMMAMRLAVRFWLTNDPELPPMARFMAGRRVTPAFLFVQLLFSVSLLVYAAVPDLFGGGQLAMPAVASWICIALSTAGIVLAGWAWRAIAFARQADDFSLERLAVPRGPYRSIRYPFEAADIFFYGCLAISTGNVWVILIWAGAVLVERARVIRQLEAARRLAGGKSYEVYADSTGILFPPIVGEEERQYTVPKRFGMAAIVALFTALGVLFAILRYWQASPAVYLFVSSEVVAICLAQIIFGSAPRGVSILTGALLLPFWVFAAMKIEGQGRPEWMSPTALYAIFGFLFAFGGLLGYCIGALAAGFFLVMDMIEAAWIGTADVAGPSLSVSGGRPQIGTDGRG